MLVAGARNKAGEAGLDGEEDLVGKSWRVSSYPGGGLMCLKLRKRFSPEAGGIIGIFLTG